MPALELLCTGSGITSDTQTNTNTDTDTNINIKNNINNHINRAILGFPQIQCFVPRVQKPRGKAMSGECTYDGLTCFDYASTGWRKCTEGCGFGNGPCTRQKRCAICTFEEQSPDACLCPKNIAAIRDARLKQLIRKHWVDRPAPAGLPDDLREDWNDKAALKAGPRVCAPKVLSDPVGHIDTPCQSNEPIVLSLPPGFPEAEPAAGHQAVPAARAAGAGCQPAAGAGCQPVASARPHPAPVAAGPSPAPIWAESQVSDAAQ